MINFSIPGLYQHSELNTRLLETYNIYRDYFYDDVQIDAVFGIFPFCIWDGGRINNDNHQCTIEEINNLIELYNIKYNMPIRLVFSNSQLKEEDYYDRYGNLLLQLCHNNMNQIVVSDDNFAEYIKANYPNYKFISSTTKNLNADQLINELDKDLYYKVCLNFNLNSNLNLLKTLNKDQLEKCEILVNASCIPGCPNREEHYRLNGLYNLNYGEMYKIAACPFNSKNNNTILPTSINNLTIENIKDTYYPLGINHYKLEGRMWKPAKVANHYCLYMVKPEYQLKVSTILLKPLKY